MAKEANKSPGLLFDISEHLGAIFRHMLPGVIVLGGAAAAYPDTFDRLDLTSWHHLFVLAVITLAVGNAWFALNRYGVHQMVDYFLYLIRSDGPARGTKHWNYLTDLGKYTSKSLHTPGESARARQHVAFRASTVLLLLTLGELAWVFSYHHACASKFQGQEIPLRVLGTFALAVACWQMVITRRIDFFVTSREGTRDEGSQAEASPRAS